VDDGVKRVEVSYECAQQRHHEYAAATQTI